MIANKLCLLAKEKITHTNTLQTNAPEQIHIHKPYLENLHEFVNNNGQQNSQHNAMEPRRLAVGVVGLAAILNSKSLLDVHFTSGINML